MKWNLMLAALGAAVLATPAFAHQSRQEEHARGDAPVGHQEMQARADRWFGRLDANGDGHVTAPEIQRRRDGTGGGDHERGRGHHGRDGDSFGALRDGGEVNLARLDANRDGVATRDEIKAAKEARRSWR